MNETYPVLEYYQKQNILYNIDSVDIDEVFNKILDIINYTGPKA
jgi:adenylate kinase family enzyme